MQEIINKVLEAEQEAERTVQEARGRAAEIRKQADEACEAKLQGAREQAQSLLQVSLSEARAQAAREQQEAKAEAERQNARFLQEREGAIDAAADAVVSLLVAPEYARKNPREGFPGAAGT